MAGLLPASIQRYMKYSGSWSQVDRKITFANGNTFLIFMVHANDSGRTPSVAIATRERDNGLYSLTVLAQTNTGSGLELSSDGTYITAKGQSSIKYISAIHLAGTAANSFLEEDL